MDSEGHYLAQPAIRGGLKNSAWIIAAGKSAALCASTRCLGFAKRIKSLCRAIYSRPHRPAHHHADTDTAHPAPVGVGGGPGQWPRRAADAGATELGGLGGSAWARPLLAGRSPACWGPHYAGRHTRTGRSPVGGLTDGRIKVTQGRSIPLIHRYNHAPIIRTSPDRAARPRRCSVIAPPQRVAHFALPSLASRF